jgi:hypothetical protein
MSSLDELKQMLDPNSMSVPFCEYRRRQKQKRNAEFQSAQAAGSLPPPSSRIVYNHEIAQLASQLSSGCMPSEAVAGNFHASAEQAAMVVPWSKASHRDGEIALYFDSIFVVLGGSKYERLVCWHQGQGVLYALFHCPGTEEDHYKYINILNEVEGRWQHVLKHSSAAPP